MSAPSVGRPTARAQRPPRAPPTKSAAGPAPSSHTNDGGRGGRRTVRARARAAPGAGRSRRARHARAPGRGAGEDRGSAPFCCNIQPTTTRTPTDHGPRRRLRPRPDRRAPRGRAPRAAHHRFVRARTRANADARGGGGASASGGRAGVQKRERGEPPSLLPLKFSRARVRPPAWNPPQPPPPTHDLPPVARALPPNSTQPGPTQPPA